MSNRRGFPPIDKPIPPAPNPPRSPGGQQPPFAAPKPPPPAVETARDSTPRIDWLNRLGKWRSVFTGWQLGTRPIGDPESDCVRDLQEWRLLMRAEITALTSLCIRAGVFKIEDFQAQAHIEAEHLCTMLEAKFPGFKATDEGMTMDSKIASQTVKNWKP